MRMLLIIMVMVALGLSMINSWAGAEFLKYHDGEIERLEERIEQLEAK